jgi:DNA polymerase-3 subunit epsilon
MTLTEMKVLALDCQATAAHPDKGRLLEIGWVAGGCGSSALPDPSAVTSYLIRSPLPMPIPPAVQRITGILDTSTAHAVSEQTAWRQLITIAKSIARENSWPLCPTVIHYARFEIPFLRRLHETNAPQAPFPFDIICTHAIAIRLLPHLPRRGLRALSGYLGHCLPELRRSADHALATVVIWKAVVELLESRCKVSSLEQLADWLARTPRPSPAPRVFPMDPGIRRNLPDQPGVYRMRRANAGILYIGKAKSLKKRVGSYFRSRAAHPEHILEMLSQALDLDYSKTATALQAAVLESDEIKRHRPPYNIALRSGQRQLVFFTRDFNQHATRCDRHFRIGPLPFGKLTEALAAFAVWLKNGMRLTGDHAVSAGYAILGLSFLDPPEIQCLQEGFDLFQFNHMPRLQNHSALRIVTSLGAALWREGLKSLEDAQPDTDREPEDGDATVEKKQSPQSEHVWTPADVAGAIEGMLMRSAYLLRQARWFCLISESSLAWAPADHPHELKNLVIFEKGQISDTAVLYPGQKPPEPPGVNRSWPKRQQNLDLFAWDRLRVVTTELRRLIGEGRNIELRLGKERCLTYSGLEKALKWV